MSTDNGTILKYVCKCERKYSVHTLTYAHCYHANQQLALVYYEWQIHDCMCTYVEGNNSFTQEFSPYSPMQVLYSPMYIHILQHHTHVHDTYITARILTN